MKKMKLLFLKHLPCKKYLQHQCRSLTELIHHQPFEPLEFQQTTASLRSVSLNPCFYLLGLCKNLVSLRKVHGIFVVHGFTNNLLCETKLVSLYNLFGKIGYAQLVFEQIRNPDFYSWKVMLRCYFLNDSHSAIIRFYTRLRQCLREQDNIVFSIVLKACSELRDITEGRKIHSHIVKVGGPDSFVLTGLVDMYAKCREIQCSRDIFDEIPDRNVVCWSSMIVGYVQNDCCEEGLLLFNRMREGLVEGNQFTLGSVVMACTRLGALHQGKWVHGYVIKNGVDFNSFLVTSLLDMYAKCGVITDARSVYDEFSIVDLVTWTAMIVGYTQSNLPEKALLLFTDKNSASLQPNSVTISSVISSCAQVGHLSLGSSVHSLGIKLGLEDNTVRNALVDMYSKFHMTREAHFMFESIEEKDLISWNSIISGFSQNGFSYETLELFHLMRLNSFSPDAVTIVSVLSSCASLGCLHMGSSLHAYSVKEGFELSNVYIGTSLINFYAKCGDPISARKIFDEMEEKTAITWSAIIGGYGMHGDSCESIALFDKMLKERSEPNDVIFTTILTACSHTGKIGEGWKYFNLMCHNYNFLPSMKHYACMVDLLARSGKLEEALEFVDKLTVKPSLSLMGAFLHGCVLHSRFDLAEVTMRRILEMHPDEASYYVLMSNLYTSNGRWREANQVRELLKRRGLVKCYGCSVVDMDIGDECYPLKVASLT